MRILQLTQSISSDLIKEKMKSSISVSDYKRWQIIYYVNTYKVNAEYLSDVTGYSKANVYAIVQQFNRTKTADVSFKGKGGRKRELMSIEEEHHLMASLEDKALSGQILSGKDIRKIVEQKVNKPVSDDYIWDLFKRNGWTKHSPRPHHPMKNNNKQEEFKKNSKTIWMPLKMLLAQN
jgi:transposase